MRQLRAAWRNFARSFVFFYEDILLWVGLCLIQGVALLTIVFVPPVFAGLNVVARRAVEGKHSKFGHFSQAVRTHFWRSYQYLGVWVVVFFLLFFNILFYFQYTAPPLQYLAFLWFSLALMWLTTLPFLIPTMLETDPPSLRSVFRNTFILTFSHPLYSFSLLLQCLLFFVLIVYVFFGIVVLLPAFMALTGNLGVRYLIRASLSPDDSTPSTTSETGQD